MDFSGFSSLHFSTISDVSWGRSDFVTQVCRCTLACVITWFLFFYCTMSRPLAFFLRSLSLSLSLALSLTRTLSLSLLSCLSGKVWFSAGLREMILQTKESERTLWPTACLEVCACFTPLTVESTYGLKQQTPVSNQQIKHMLYHRVTAGFVPFLFRIVCFSL